MSDYNKNRVEGESYQFFQNSNKRYINYRYTRLGITEYDNQLSTKQAIFKAVILSGEHGGISVSKKKKGMLINPILQKRFPDGTNRSEVKFRITEVLYDSVDDFTATLPNPMQASDFMDRQYLASMHPIAYSEMSYDLHNNIFYGSVVTIKQMSNLFLIVQSTSVSGKSRESKAVVKEAPKTKPPSHKKTMRTTPPKPPKDLFDCPDGESTPRPVLPIAGKGYKYASMCSPRGNGTLGSLALNGKIGQAILEAKKIVIFGDSQAEPSSTSYNTKFTDGKLTLGRTLQEWWEQLPEKVGANKVVKKKVFRHGKHSTQPYQWVDGKGLWKNVKPFVEGGPGGLEEGDFVILFMGGNGTKGAADLAKQLESVAKSTKAKIVWIGAPPSTMHKAEYVKGEPTTKFNQRKKKNEEIKEILSKMPSKTWKFGSFSDLTFINPYEDVPSFTKGYDTRKGGKPMTDGVHMVGKWALGFLIEVGLIPNAPLYEELVTGK